MPQMRASAVLIGAQIVKFPGLDVSKLSNAELEALQAQLVFGVKTGGALIKPAPKAKTLSDIPKP